MDAKTLFTIIHLFGVALGAGGAYVSDWIFLNAIKDHKLSKDEHNILRAASVAIWAGLAVLYISGVGLVLQDPAYFLSSEKFLVKAGIVGIITINGIILHARHMPILSSFIDRPRMERKEIRKHAPRIILSGAVSIVSWSFAIILGSLDALPLPLLQVFGIYIITILLGWLIGLGLSHRFSR